MPRSPHNMRHARARTTSTSRTRGVGVTASTTTRIVLVPPSSDAPSYLRYPPALNRPSPSWQEVLDQTAKRMAWLAPENSLVVDVCAADDVERLQQVAVDADACIWVDADKTDDADGARGALTAVPTLLALNSADDIDAHDAHGAGAAAVTLDNSARWCYQPASALMHDDGAGRAFRQLMAGIGAGKDDAQMLKRLANLHARQTHLDFLYMCLLVADDLRPAGAPRVPFVSATSKADASALLCMASKCGKQTVACLSDPMCKRAVDCLDECGLGDQVCSYICIRSYETKEFEKFTTCFIDRNNCLRNSASRPDTPHVTPTTTFRGEPLTWEGAEEIFVGHLYGDEGYSWLSAAGQNPAYDEFNCQYQLFYQGKARNSFWYNPVFLVKTLPDSQVNGASVWRGSDYRCQRLETPGEYLFTFCDNGATSKERWCIVEVDDNLEWALFYYSGAAVGPGQSYIGAVLGTRTGVWPEDEESRRRIETALQTRCSIPLWEMVQVDNSNCADPPLTPKHAPRRAFPIS